jgi:glycosyltransferase involved in cell wall biosynthesis
VIYLFIHQNFPGQYRHVIRMLADQPGNYVYFISQPNKTTMEGIRKIHYTVEQPRSLNCHPLTVSIDRAIRSGMAVAEVCRMLKNQGVKPDVVVGHSGWGETLFVKDVFPDVPLLAYFEFFYQLNGADLDFDPEFSSVFSTASRVRTRNAVNLLAFESADWGHTPTRWQHSLHPPDMRRKITVIHEGVDTDIVRPSSDAVLTLPKSGLTLTRKNEVVTYVARNLEPYRGFPKAHIVIVGGDGVSYGAPAAPRSTYREFMLEEVGKSLDLERIHFLGQVEYDTYLKVLQVSSAHVYLTYPFILSWSCIEALAAGCLVIGSKTAPVEEVIKDGVNGLLVDFFSPDDLARRVNQVFRHRDQMKDLRAAARRTAMSGYDLKRKALPKWAALLKDLTRRKRSRNDGGAGRGR